VWDVVYTGKEEIPDDVSLYLKTIEQSSALLHEIKAGFFEVRRSHKNARLYLAITPAGNSKYSNDTGKIMGFKEICAKIGVTSRIEACVTSGELARELIQFAADELNMHGYKLSEFHQPCVYSHLLVIGKTQEEVNEVEKGR
jgi:hypothetical protein